MNQFESIIQQDKLILVDFFATWCGPCKMLEPVLQDVKKELTDKITILKIDIDKNTALTTHYSTKYQMRGVPTLMLFRKGKMLWKQSGFTDKQTIINSINYYQNNK
ncbi:thioredoxin [Myroides sp. LJL119]